MCCGGRRWGMKGRGGGRGEGLAITWRSDATRPLRVGIRPGHVVMGLGAW
jgi:hypothetical protein